METKEKPQALVIEEFKESLSGLLRENIEELPPFILAAILEGAAAQMAAAHAMQVNEARGEK